MVMLLEELTDIDSQGNMRQTHRLPNDHKIYSWSAEKSATHDA